MTGQRGDEPGPYSGLFGSVPDSYSYRPAVRPKQVTIAAVVSAGLGAMCLLLAVLTLTSAGAQISEVLTGSRGNTSVAVAAALVCAFIYLVPAIYVRKRYVWARYMLIAVAVMGIAGGLMALPTSLLGLAIHVTLLILMLQRPTKLWFQHR
ncbi:hypothetical protein ACFV9C_17000 [Kribbella sp. NPDC059898]|uniref:hypothetical protein n=1 Tax=Kribbella sp. NPDC059898 TaxID=3346995 RepID=UPI00365EFD92